MKETLEEAIKNDDLILFVGAGMSIPLGFPNWAGLIQKILIKLEKEIEGADCAFNFSYYIKKGDSIDVFEVLNELERLELKQNVKQILNSEIESVDFSESDLKRFEKLWLISDKIITTNYDRVLESVKPKNVKSFVNTNKFQQARSLSGTPFLYKIHGDIEDPDTCTLFTSDYESIYTEGNPNKETFKSFLLNKTVLFLGFSLDDPYVSEQMNYLHNLYNGYTKKHVLVSTTPKDLLKNNIKTHVINGWGIPFDEFLDKLVAYKKSYSKELTASISPEAIDVSKIDDLVRLESLFDDKKAELEKGNELDKRSISKELFKIRDKIIELRTKEFNFEALIPKNEEVELEHVFDTIFKSEILSKELISQINNVKNQQSERYSWYHRSVIVSSLACSLINHKKVDSQKIDLLIDFTNDSEPKVWEKAITYLLLVLNHLGNKWLRFNFLIPKLEGLKERDNIQKALNSIVALMQFGLQGISPLDSEIFKNGYFKESPFNYFLPFYKGNPSVDKLYENDNIDDVKGYIKSLYNIPLPDALKYLLCNTVNKKIEKKIKSKKELQNINNMLQLHIGFEPFLNHVNTFLNFYLNSPASLDIELNQKITVRNLKKHLFTSIEQHRAYARQFMLDKAWGKAITHYEQLLVIDKEDIDALSNMATCYDYSKKNIDEKLRLRLSIETIDPNYIKNLFNISDLYKEKGKYKKGISYIDKVINLDGKNSDAYFRRGYLYGKLEFLIEAIEDYNIAVSLNEKYIDAYFNRAVAKADLNRHEEAIEDYDIVISLDDRDVVAYVNRGVSKGNLMFYDDALLDLDKAISLDNKKIDAFVNKSNIYRRTGDFEQAHVIIDKAINLDKTDGTGYGGKSTIYASEGNNQKFYELLEKAFQLKAKAKWLDDDIKMKYKNEEQFKVLLEKYKQKI